MFQDTPEGTLPGAVKSAHAPLPTLLSLLQNLLRVRREKLIWQSLLPHFCPTTTILLLNFRSELQPWGVPGLTDVMDTPRVYAEGASGVCSSCS